MTRKFPVRCAGSVFGALALILSSGCNPSPKPPVANAHSATAASTGTGSAASSATATRLPPVSYAEEHPLADGGYKADFVMKSTAPTHVKAGATENYEFVITNRGISTFPALPAPSGKHNVYFSYRVFRKGDPKTNVIFNNLTRLNEDLGPGQSVTLPITVKYLPAPGEYEIRFDLIHDEFTYFEDRKNPPYTMWVTVQ